MERLQKVIATSGYCSRRKAEELITNGKVSINGNIITTLGTKVKNSDEILVEGTIIDNKKSYEYYLLNKPREVISAVSDNKHRKTVTDIVKTNARIYPIGRLDYDTTGLILLTNDGNLANMLMHPSYNIDKTYVAKVKGIVTGYEIKKLRNGILIDNYKTSKAKVKLRKINKKENNSIVEITIHEGHNQQVRKMFESLGHEVIKLKREKYSFLTLDGVKTGEYRPLTIKEVKKLYNSKK